MKNLYLILAVIGCVLPYYFFISFFTNHWFLICAAIFLLFLGKENGDFGKTSSVLKGEKYASKRIYCLHKVPMPGCQA